MLKMKVEFKRSFGTHNKKFSYFPGDGFVRQFGPRPPLLPAGRGLLAPCCDP
jgi:hypothetical protein